MAEVIDQIHFCALVEVLEDRNIKTSSITEIDELKKLKVKLGVYFILNCRK